jgi:hypothetical protein
MVLGVVVVMASPAPASAWVNELDEVTLSESGGLSDRTLAALDTFSAVLGVRPTVLQSGTIRMIEVRRDTELIQGFAPGFGVPMAFVAVDPESAFELIGADVAGPLERGVVMSTGSAAIRGAQVGDLVTLQAWDGTFHVLEIAALVDDRALAWNEIVLSIEQASDLGIERPSAAVMWGVNTMVVDLLAQAVLGDAPVRVRGPGSERAPFVDGVLPMVSIKERFGEFAFRETRGDGIETDDEWFEANIVTVIHPRLGEFRCHRAVLPAIEGALDELERLGLADEIDPLDFQAAGGCYNARLARGGDLDRGFALSRHSWGVAIDFNPSTNGFGVESSLSEDFGQVFRDWGFAWGAGWRVPDPMHFEWHGEPDDPGRSGCVGRLASTLAVRDFGQVPSGCLP